MNFDFSTLHAMPFPCVIKNIFSLVLPYTQEANEASEEQARQNLAGASAIKKAKLMGR